MSTFTARARAYNRATRERLEPIGEDNMDNITTTVHLTDLTGHQTLELTQDETIALVEDQGPNTWVFAQGSMMQPTQLADADWGAIGTVRVTPGLVGGC